MNAINNDKTPLWFWCIGAVALVWNLAGLAAFFMHLSMTPELLAQLPEAHQALYTEAPDWLNAAFGIAVIGGTLGSIMLLLKNIFAVILYSLSLLGVLAQNSYSFFMSDTFAVLGSEAMIMPIAVIIIALFLMWYSLQMKCLGLLR
ncbi:hypothetical protein QWY82_05250 [Simiduia curdlanivorans]|uniref:DUF4345 domain-containing protein n=1 Tax=Simiduia curdlanivorans TaxID=1492769 RepID=A0ABV8V3I6_9GAMM|nr:hypothetical protein [Simiduia curdlanivorans]MDN3638216.1 hypothetical protein [Simiduia curdlanivorans]